MFTFIIHNQSLKNPHTKVLLLCLVILIFSFYAMYPVYAALTIKLTATPSLTTGLVGYWNFDETSGNIAHDHGGGNNGTLINITGNPWTLGNTGLGNALSLDGVNDYVSVPAIVGASLTTNFTIAFWTYLNSHSYHAIFLGNVNGADNGALLLNDATDYGGICGQHSGGSLGFCSNGLIPLGQWVHVVYIKNGTSAAVYFNGIPQPVYDANNGAATFNAPTAGTLNIGLAETGQASLNGKIDEFRIYNRVLSQAEVTKLYNEKKTVFQQTILQSADQTGMVGWWKMDEGQGVSAGDSSGKRNNGSLTGMASPATATSGWGQGKNNKGNGLNFDGSNDLVDISDNPTLTFGTSDFAWSAWVKSAVIPTDRKPIIASTGCSNNNTCLMVYVMQNGGTNGWSFTTNSVQAGFSDTVVANTWYHVVLVRQSGTTFFYRNGQLLGTSAILSGLNFDFTGLRFGYDTFNGTALNGSIDDVRIYNRALSQTEITKIYKEKAALKQGVALSNNTLTTGLVGYWNFDGKNTGATYTTDSSGSGNTGTLTNGPVATIGKIGQALKFDGVNDYVNVPDSSVFTLSSGYTVSAWVNITTFPTTGNQIYNIAGQWGAGGAGNAAWRIYTVGNNLAIANCDCSTSVSLTDNTTPLSVNRWYHFAGVYTGGTTGTNAILYVNGSQVKTGTLNAIPQNSSYFMGMGAIAAMGADNFLNGSIDDLRIYNRALSAAEVKRLYNGGR